MFLINMHPEKKKYIPGNKKPFMTKAYTKAKCKQHGSETNS